MAFHWEEGWYFERITAAMNPERVGWVRVYHLENDSPNALADVDIEIDADSWASIVASVSAEGDTARAFAAASELHNGGSTPPGTEQILYGCSWSHTGPPTQEGGSVT